MIKLIKQINAAYRNLRQQRQHLVVAEAENSEAVRRIHRARERIGRGKAELRPLPTDRFNPRFR